MTPTRAQRAAGFAAAKKKVVELMEDLVPWEDISLSDDEIHQVSDAAIEAALNVNPAGDDNG